MRIEITNSVIQAILREVDTEPFYSIPNYDYFSEALNFTARSFLGYHLIEGIGTETEITSGAGRIVYRELLKNYHIIFKVNDDFSIKGLSPSIEDITTEKIVRDNKETLAKGVGKTLDYSGSDNSTYNDNNNGMNEVSPINANLGDIVTPNFKDKSITTGNNSFTYGKKITEVGTGTDTTTHKDDETKTLNKSLSLPKDYELYAKIGTEYGLFGIIEKAIQKVIYEFNYGV